MRLIESSWWRAGRWEFLRFLIAGGFNTAAGYGLYLLLLNWCSYPVAYTITYLFGVGLAYGLTCGFVFRHRARLVTALHFPIVYGVQYVVGMALLAFFVAMLGLDPRLGPLLVVVCTVPVSFFLSARVIRGSARPPVVAKSG